MATHYARTAYLQAKVQPETDPKRLILMLYEGVLEDLRLAKEGIEQQDARKRGEHLSRAVAIVSTLLTSLHRAGRVTKVVTHDHSVQPKEPKGLFLS